MRRTLLVCVALLLPVQSPEIKAAGLQSASPQRAALDTYCSACHNERLRTAGLRLDTAGVDHPETNAAVWEKVLQKLRTREMPPPGSGVPTVPLTIRWQTTSKLRSIGLRKPDPILADRPCIASIVFNMPMPSAT